MARKKIYDIKHPRKKTDKVDKEIKEFFSPEPVKRSRKAPSRTSEAVAKKAPATLAAPVYHEKSAKSGKKIGLAVTGIVLVALAGFLFFKLPKADIEIWPVVETKPFTQVLVADKSVQMPDTAKAVIPAQYLEAEKTVSESFPATGNASNEGKAKGTITLYNKFDPVAPLTLKAGTRFMSDSGKVFLSVQKVVVPAATKSGSKVTPGAVQVPVEAAEGGEAYNIKASSFSVPGLKGTPYYFAIYGNSAAAMTGGYAGNVKKVTQDDIDNASDVLEKRVLDEAMNELKQKLSDDFVLLDNAVVTETTQKDPVKVGAVGEKFTMTVTGKTKAVAFKRSDAEQYVKSYIISKAAPGKTVLDGSIKQEYTVSSLDISSGKVTLNANFSAGVYTGIDKNDVALSLLGQTESQVTQTLQSRFGDQVSRMQVKLWPFWVKTVPDNQKALNIFIRFE